MNLNEVLLPNDPNKQGQESLSGSTLDYLCKAGVISWSCSIHFNKTKILLLCKVMFHVSLHPLIFL